MKSFIDNMYSAPPTMSHYSEIYYDALKNARVDSYTPDFSSSLATLEDSVQLRLHYATSRMRSIAQSIITNPGRWDNPEFNKMLEIETVCSENISEANII